MSNEDPKDTYVVTDTREEDVIPAGLGVGQATIDVLDVTQVMSTANEVKNQATSDVLDVTQAMSSANMRVGSDGGGVNALMESAPMATQLRMAAEAKMIHMLH
jgi:hypothetical protein